MVARTVPSAVGPLTIYAVTSLDICTSRRAVPAQLAADRSAVAGCACGVVDLAGGRPGAWRRSMRCARRWIASKLPIFPDVCKAGSSDDEIANLGLTLNRMLDRLEEASSRQQLFAAAASHELRSPLSTIRTELEVGLAYPDRAEWTKVAEDSLIEVARLEDLTRDLRLLTRSRSMQVSATAPIDLSDLVAAEVALRRPRRAITLQHRVGSRFDSCGSRRGGSCRPEPVRQRRATRHERDTSCGVGRQERRHVVGHERRSADPRRASENGSSNRSCGSTRRARSTSVGVVSVSRLPDRS